MTTYSYLVGASADPVSSELVDLYATVYAEPPYEEGPEQVEGFRTRMLEDTSRAGFTLVTARTNDQLVGAAFGWTMPAGTWWSRADAQPSRDVLDADKFAVMEWIVRPDQRGKGIGAQLIRRLLTGRPESYATLASDPRSEARGIYERARWRQVARTTLTWGPAMDLLVIDLPLSITDGDRTAG